MGYRPLKRLNKTGNAKLYQGLMLSASFFVRAWRQCVIFVVRYNECLATRCVARWVASAVDEGAFNDTRSHSLHAPIERGRDIPNEAAGAPYTTARGRLFARSPALTRVDAFDDGRLHSLHAPIERVAHTPMGPKRPILRPQWGT
jgi:hypothetical protein